jgi:hypothetical protein
MAATAGVDLVDLARKKEVSPKELAGRRHRRHREFAEEISREPSRLRIAFTDKTPDVIDPVSTLVPSNLTKCRRTRG